MYEEHAQGDGQYDAFMNALKRVYKKQKLELPLLSDYAVRIPPGGKSDALCETIITWLYNNREFKTRGLDSDQTVAAIKATLLLLHMSESWGCNVIVIGVLITTFVLTAALVQPLAATVRK